MNDAEAAQQLQTIRTLMERAALYRRALGPILLAAGLVGASAATLGWGLGLGSAREFLLLWISAAVLAILSSLLLVRRQALQEREPFWTPPTRRVVSAMLPALFAGAVATVALAAIGMAPGTLAVALPAAWLVCYGLAVHGAGFFTLRGIRQLGWAFTLAGEALALAAIIPGFEPTLRHAHLFMGLAFGLGHLAAGAWLLLAERNNAP